MEVFLIASMTVAIVVTSYFMWLQNKAVLHNPFDSWIKSVIVVILGAIFVDIIQAVNKGYFLYHMIKCYRASDEDTVDFALLFGLVGGLCTLIFVVDYVWQRRQYNLSLEPDGGDDDSSSGDESSWKDNGGKDHEGNKVIDLSNGNEQKEQKKIVPVTEREGVSKRGTEKDSSSISGDDSSSEDVSTVGPASHDAALTTTPSSEDKSFVAPTEYHSFKPARAPAKRTTDDDGGLNYRTLSAGGVRDDEEDYYT